MEESLLPNRDEELSRLSHENWDPVTSGYDTVEEEVADVQFSYSEKVKDVNQREDLDLDDEQIIFDAFVDFVYHDKPEKLLGLISEP